MKKVFLSIVAIAALVALPMSVSAQSTVTSVTSGAKIVVPLSLSKTGGTLNFGTMAQPSAAVSIILGTDKSRTASVPANIDLITDANNAPDVPVFAVTGASGYAYTVTLPDNETVVFGSTTLELTNFVTDLTSNIGTVGTDNSFKIGATLGLEASEASGTYEGAFDVTISYN